MDLSNDPSAAMMTITRLCHLVFVWPITAFFQAFWEEFNDDFAAANNKRDCTVCLADDEEELEFNDCYNSIIASINNYSNSQSSRLLLNNLIKRNGPDCSIQIRHDLLDKYMECGENGQWSRKQLIKFLNIVLHKSMSEISLYPPEEFSQFSTLISELGNRSKLRGHDSFLTKLKLYECEGSTGKTAVYLHTSKQDETYIF